MLETTTSYSTRKKFLLNFSGNQIKINKELHLLIPCLPVVRENCTLNKEAKRQLQDELNRA